MQDDWAMYCEELNKIQVNPTQISTPHINGATHQNGTSTALSKLMFAAVNDRIEEMEERLAKERGRDSGHDYDRHSHPCVRT